MRTQNSDHETWLYKTQSEMSKKPRYRFLFVLAWLCGVWMISLIPTASSQPPVIIPTTQEQIGNLSLAELTRWSRHLWQETKKLQRKWRKIFLASNVAVRNCLKPHDLQLRKSRYKLTLVWKSLRQSVSAQQETAAREKYGRMVKLWEQAQAAERHALLCVPVPVKKPMVRKKSPRNQDPDVSRDGIITQPKPAKVAVPNTVAQPTPQPTDTARTEPAPDPASAPPAPPAEAPRRLRVKVKKQRVLVFGRRTTTSFDSSTVSGELIAPGHGSGAVGGSANRATREESGVAGRDSRDRRPMQEQLKGKKDKDKQTKKVQTWQRHESNTTLSKVSVGGGKYLILKKLRVSAQMEGMRVRTIIDHIYYNPFDRTLQGTFKYTLPPDASVSYYAMFVGQQRARVPNFFSGKAPSTQDLLRMKPEQVARTTPHTSWGRLREARLVAAEQGRQVYEEITRQQIDPALLEQDAPNTFTGRVFPIAAKGYNRVILAYEETLPQIEGQHIYRFRFPPDVADMIDFSIGYNPKHGQFQQTSLQKQRCQFPKKPGDSLIRCYWENNMPRKDAVFVFRPHRSDITWVAGIDPMDRQQYLFAQARVTLPTKTVQQGSQHAIFLLDTSLSAQPDLFAAHVSLLQQILEKNQHIQKFNVLFFDVGVTWARAGGWIANTPAEREKLLAKIRQIVLEGATNLAAAMNALASPPWFSNQQADSSDLDVFFLSDGQLNWGNLQVDKILHRFQQKKPWKHVRFFAYQLGIGSENLGLLRQLVRQGGSIFPCLGQAEIVRCATAHNQASLFLERVEIEGISASQVLVAGRQTNVFPGGLIALGTQFQKSGAAKVHLIGQYQGKPFRQTYEISVQVQGDLGPRAWAELAIAQLLEVENPKLRNLIVAYSQHFHIPNRYCSFLILETDKEYKQYGLEQERKAQKVSDVSQFLARLWQEKSAPLAERERWIHLLKRSLEQFKALNQSSGRTAMLLLQTLPDSDFHFTSQEQNDLWLRSRVPGSYLDTRMKNREDFTPFVTEAQRRLDGSLAGAVRSLSCIVELNPSNPQALRLVGYYLRAWNRPDLAALVFFRVLERRPFEPHAYRDVAISLIRMKRYGLAAVLYEVMLAGQWHNRFGSFKRLAHEEYSLLLYEAFQQGKLLTSVQQQLHQRKSMLGLEVQKAGLRVTVTWNTDNTDIDLWVTGPQGHRCYYRNKSTPDGGQLLEDITRGYGPERYENRQPPPGNYHIQLQYYGHRTNVFGNETHVSIILVQHAGTPEQSIVFKSLVLRHRKQIVDVARLKI